MPPHERTGVVPPLLMIGQVPETEVTYVPATCAPMVLYEMVWGEEPLKVVPEEAPEPRLLKVRAFATEPAEPPMERDEVEVWARAVPAAFVYRIWLPE